MMNAPAGKSQHVSHCASQLLFTWNMEAQTPSFQETAVGRWIQPFWVPRERIAGELWPDSGWFVGICSTGVIHRRSARPSQLTGLHVPC